MRFQFSIFFILSFTLSHTFSWGFSDDFQNPNILNNTDSITLQITPDGAKRIIHKVKPQQTLYSIATFYGLTVNDLYFYNPVTRSRGLSIEQPLYIPISNNLITFDRPLFVSGYAPIFYTVKPKETMFHLANRYFHIPLELLQKNNGMSDYALQPKQKVLVGWLSLKGIPKESREGKTIVQQISQRNRNKFFTSALSKRVKKSKGAAFWKENKHSTPSMSLVVMHRTAKLNSIMKIYNPVNNRTIYAKVIGRVPPSTHKNIQLIVSPIIAKAMQATSNRFYVQIEYF